MTSDKPIEGTTGVAKAPPTPDPAAHPVAAAPSAAAVHAGSHSGQPATGSGRSLIVRAIVILALIAAGIYAFPIVRRMLNTVSTDDAYVNSHVTYVAARVPGQVVTVLVDDNFRVRQGDTIVELDRQPYQVLVDAKRAARDVAKADVLLAEEQVRGMVAQARANRFKLEHAIEHVNDQIATLRSSVAALQTAQAELDRADADYKRALKLQATPGVITQEELDLRRATFRKADAGVKQAFQQIYQIRASLGLPTQPTHGDDLSEVPPNLDQSFSTVRQALAELLQSAAPLGIKPPSYDATPAQVIEAFYKLDPEGKGNLDRIYAKLITEASQSKFANAKLLQAQSDLDQAELNLSYCTVTAEIDGVVTRRDVNPGNNVIAGQSLMAVRSLKEIWIDANFKETQLAELKIGQAVDLDVDMYGSRKEFRGRISGFTMGTGSTLALLPAENATGNFVKVVQRLPVRIDLVDYDPDNEKQPLFDGLSVTPHVLVKEPLADVPNAGQLLQSYSPHDKSAKKSEQRTESKPEKRP